MFSGSMVRRRRCTASSYFLLLASAPALAPHACAFSPRPMLPTHQFQASPVCQRMASEHGNEIKNGEAYTSSFVGTFRNETVNGKSTMSSSASVIETTFANGDSKHDEEIKQRYHTGARHARNNNLELGSLGDIMDSGLKTSTSAASTSESSAASLCTKYGIDNPLDRMAITANGNLQRLFASYYDSPVSVVVDFCRLREDDQVGDTKVWDRRVHLVVHGRTFCTADSTIYVHDSHCQALVESKRVGLGQLFRYLDLLPEFTLLEAGIDGGCWRRYTLSCPDYVTCQIFEVFVENAWRIKPNDGDGNGAR